MNRCAAYKNWRTNSKDQEIDGLGRNRKPVDKHLLIPSLLQEVGPEGVGEQENHGQHETVDGC